MIGYPSDRLREEVAYLAWHFHWPYAAIMEMDHRERGSWVEEIVRIQERLVANGTHGGIG